MPSIYGLKRQFQSLLRPVTRSIARRGISANQVTVAAMLSSFVVGGSIILFPQARWPLLIVPGFLFIRMALNAIDGMLAREHDMKSDLGMVLNEVGDVLADAALYLPFALTPGIRSDLVVTLVVLAVTSELAGVVAVQICGERRYDGPMGKSDRAFFFGSLSLLMACDVTAGVWTSILLGLVIVLLAMTVINRTRHALATANASLPTESL